MGSHPRSAEAKRESRAHPTRCTCGICKHKINKTSKLTVNLKQIFKILHIRNTQFSNQNNLLNTITDIYYNTTATTTIFLIISVLLTNKNAAINLNRWQQWINSIMYEMCLKKTK